MLNLEKIQIIKPSNTAFHIKLYRAKPRCQTTSAHSVEQLFASCASVIVYSPKTANLFIITGRPSPAYPNFYRQKRGATFQSKIENPVFSRKRGRKVKS